MKISNYRLLPIGQQFIIRDTEKNRMLMQTFAKHHRLLIHYPILIINKAYTDQYNENHYLDYQTCSKEILSLPICLPYDEQIHYICNIIKGLQPSLRRQHTFNSKIEILLPF
jgi:hypothetical protein